MATYQQTMNKIWKPFSMAEVFRMLTNASVVNKTAPSPSPPPQNEATFANITIGIDTVLALIGISGFIGNLIIAIIILKRRKLQTPTNWFVFNLAISDLAIVIITIPIYIVNPFISWPFLLIGCKYLIMPVMEHFAGVCVLSHTAISFARYAVLSNIRFGNISLLKLTNTFICAIWLISFLVLSAPLMGLLGEFKLATNETGMSVCYLHWISAETQKIYRVFVFILTYVIPMVTTGYSYYRIHRIVLNSLRSVNSFLPFDVLFARRQKRRQLDIMLTVMYVMFAVTTLPLQLFMFLINFNLISKFRGGQLTFSILLLIFYLQILINPLVLLYMGEEYRKGLAELSACFASIRKISCLAGAKAAWQALNKRYKRLIVVPSSGKISITSGGTSDGKWETSSGVTNKKPRVKLSRHRRGGSNISRTTLNTEISQTSSSMRRQRPNSLQRLTSNRKCSANPRSDGCNETPPNTIRRSHYIEKHDRRSANNYCIEERSNGSQRRLLMKVDSNGSVDENYNKKRESTSRWPPYLKLDSSSSSLEDDYKELRLNTLQRPHSYIKMDSSSSLEEDYHDKRLNTLRRPVDIRLDSSSSLDDKFDSSSSLDDVFWNEKRLYSSRITTMSITQENSINVVSEGDNEERLNDLRIYTFEKSRLSDVQEDYSTDKRQSEIDYVVPTNEWTEPTQRHSNAFSRNSALLLHEKRSKRATTISFVENDIRVLIPVSELEIVMNYDADDSYLHLPDQDGSDVHRETII